MTEKDIVILWDLPDNIYLKMKNSYRNYFFKVLKNNFTSLYNLAKLLKMKCSYLYNYKSGRYCISLKKLKEIVSLLPDNLKIKLLNEIEKNLEFIKFGIRNSKPIRNPKLPLVFSENSIKLSRIIGHVIGDGGIINKPYDYHVHYTNKSKKLVEHFKNDMIEVVGNVHYSSGIGKSKTRWIQFPSIVGIILIKMFGFQTKDLKHVPKVILYTNKETKFAFLRTLFDDEGGVSISKYTIAFTMTNKKVMETVKEMLKQYGINVGKISKIIPEENQKIKYRFVISGHEDLNSFNNVIGFEHPEKHKKLKLVLANYIRLQYKKGQFKNVVIDLLKEKGSLTITEIAKNTNRVLSGSFRDRIRKLEKEKSIVSQTKTGKIKVYSLPEKI